MIRKEFDAEVLDQEQKVLATARVLRNGDSRGGIFCILSGFPADFTCKNAKYLRGEEGETERIYRLTRCTEGSNRIYVHFLFFE